MRIRKWMCVLMACILLFSGCADQAPNEVNPEDNVAMRTGGTALNEANLNSLQITDASEVEGALITMHFVQGSRKSGSTDEITGGGVPTYEVYLLDAPYRLVVQFDALSFWEYQQALSVEHPLIRGVFQNKILNDTRVSVAFQLNENVSFTTEEVGDELRIQLKKQPNKQPGQYYVTVNAYEQYCSGTWNEALGVEPTLAEDLENILLISQPFSTQREAEEFRAKVLEENSDFLPAQWNVTRLDHNALPKYDQALDLLPAYEQLMIRKEGIEEKLPVLIPNGLYLCTTPDGTGYLYSKQITTDSGQNYQQLWLMEEGEQEGRLLMRFEFSAIEKAQYSPDGRKLAVLESAGGDMHLYVFDTDTYEMLNNLSELGFGYNIGAFTWNSLGNVIYAVAGRSSLQIHQFDYSIPDETKRHTVVDKNEVEADEIGYANGQLYFTVSSLEEGSTIYHIKPDGGVRRPLIKGSNLKLSNDDRYMVITDTMDDQTKEESEYRLLLYDMQSGSTQVIANHLYAYDYVWANDDSKLYYIENRLSGGKTEMDTSDDPQVEEEDTPDDEQKETPTPDQTAAPTPSDTDEPAGGATTDEPTTPAQATQTPEHDADSNSLISLLDPYPYSLWVYDMQTKQNTKLFDMRSPDIFITDMPGILYLTYTDSDEQTTRLRATYRIELTDHAN